MKKLILLLVVVSLLNPLEAQVSQWIPVPGSSSSSIFTMIMFEGDLWIAEATLIKKFDGVNTWTITNPNASDWVTEEFCIYKGELYAAGSYLIGTDYYRVIKWDGTKWIGFAIGNINDRAYSIGVFNNKMYLGGFFDSYSLTIYDGLTWSFPPLLI